MARSQSWKDHEKTITKTLVNAGIPATRISRAGDWSQKTFDVQIEDHPRFKIDGKYSQKGFRCSRMFEEVRAKYCHKPGDEAIVVFKGYRQVGSHTMIRTEFFAELMAHYLKTQKKAPFVEGLNSNITLHYCGSG